MEQENLIKSFIGKNADIIYTKINKKGSFNIYCMLFTAIYFLYRKMYILGIISYLIQSLIAKFVNNNFISLICLVVWGYAFYPLYKMHINRKINKLAAKEFTEEEIKKKGGTSVVVAIIVPVILVVILLASVGITIMNSAMEAIDSDNNTNISNYYSYNGAKIKYGNEWQEEYVGLGGEKFKALCEKNGDIVIISLDVTDIYDEIMDYSISSVRQQFYDELINNEEAIYSENGIEIRKQTNEFKELSNNLYYAYYEIYNNFYVRNYIILDSKNDNVLSVMVFFENSITDIEEEKINEMFKTVVF